MNNNKSKNVTIKFRKKKKNKSLIESNKKELNNKKKNDINNKSLNPEDFIKVIPLNNKLTKISEPNNKISDIFEMLIKKTIKKDDEFISKKEFIIDLDLKYFELSSKINGLESLISFAKNINTELKYSFNAMKLKSLVKPLEELNDFIGMENIKNNISKQIIYYLQDLDNDANIMHTIITGPPGLGKTKLAHLLSEIYFKMNVFMKKNE